MCTGAGADLHPGVRRCVRGRRSELRAEFHQRQRPPGSQRHAALGHGRGVPPLQQDGASGLVTGDVRRVSVQSPQTRGPPGNRREPPRCPQQLPRLRNSNLPVFQVSDGALRCFASLADRFTRRGVDPAPLAKHGLTEELLSRMAAAGGTVSGPASSCKPGRTSTGGAPSAPDSKLSNQVSTIVSLLSTLCRGSPLVTHVCRFASQTGNGKKYPDFPQNKVSLSLCRTCCGRRCPPRWSRLWEEMSAACWTPCDWWTSCWCCCLRAARRCPNLRRAQQVGSPACGAWTAPGRDRTDSSSTVSAAKTQTL